MRLPAPSHITFRVKLDIGQLQGSAGWSELPHPWKEPPRPEASEDPLAAIDIQRRSQTSTAGLYKVQMILLEACKIEMLHCGTFSTSCSTREAIIFITSLFIAPETTSVIKRMTCLRQREARSHEISMDLYS